MPKGFEIGHPKLGGIKKNQKQFKTLLKEERRAVFDAKISKKWEKVIDSLRPEYVADQFIGKAQENINLNAKVEQRIISIDE